MRRTRILTWLVVGIVLGSAWPTARAWGQPRATPSLAQPVVAAPIELAADRSTAWSQGESRQFLLLEGDVRFALGAYRFAGQRAYVRIDREVRPGRTVHHAAVYLEQAASVRGGGAISAEAPRLLVTGASRGGVQLQTNLLDRAEQAPASALVQAGEARVQRWIDAMARPTLPVPDEPLYGPASAATRDERRSQIERVQVTRRLAELRQSQRETALADEAELLAGAQQRVDEQTARDEARARAAARRAAMPSGAAPAPGTADTLTTPAEQAAQSPELAAGPPRAPETSVLPVSGRLAFSADRVVGQPMDGETALLLIGDVTLIYIDEQGETAMSLQAERAVLFIGGELEAALRGGEMAAGDVSGVYLEDNVIASEGQYTVRAPRMFYDLASNRAVLLEAVLYTWDTALQVPMYVRADTIRQTSARSFQANDALLTTSEFAEPHVALGAGRVVVEQSSGDGDASVTAYRAVHNTVQVAGVPVFYWPVLAGRNLQLPLRSISAGYSSDDGFRLQTEWDAFALVGREQPEGIDLGVNFDYLGDHGPATGFSLKYEKLEMFGEGRGYIVPNDHGDDELGSGRRDIEHDGEVRGFAHWQHRQELRYDIELSLEGAYVSDETFLENYFEQEAAEAKPYETSAYLKKDNENWAVSVLASTNVMDFTPQLTTLQSPGYEVEKLPELSWWVTGASLWDDRLTWYTQSRLTRARLLLGGDSPADRGFRDRESAAIFGMADARTSFEDHFESLGFPTGDTLRLDSRQELVAPLFVGPFNVSPFVVGRLTAYDRDFQEYSDDAEELRLWGQVGVRASTQFHRTYAAESRLLNLHGLRHIIEPSVQVAWADTTVQGDDLPVYDFYTENLQEGGNVTFGLTQTLETQRGGRGYYRNVQWITLDARYTIAEDELEQGDRYPRYFWYRPEYALGGDHFYGELLWMVSDSVALAGELTYDVDDENLVQWRINAQFDHSPRLSTLLGYENSDIVGSQTLSYAIRYQLTTKYSVGVSQSLDLERNDSRNISFNLSRKLPRWSLSVFGSWDNVDDETTLGLTLAPEGLPGLPFNLPRRDRED